MSQLHHITFTHYGPKASESGTLTWAIADDEEQVFRWLGAEEHIYSEDWEEDGDEGTVYRSEEWWAENPDERARAAATGLTIDDWGDVSGPMADLCRWARKDPTPVSETYYGVTIVAWDVGKPITSDDAATLLRLGVAVDLRAVDVEAS